MRGWTEPGRGRAAAVVAVALGVASAAMSAYWALGGTGLLDTVGGEIERWGRQRSAAVVFTLWALVIAKLAAAALPLVWVSRSSQHLPSWMRSRSVGALGWIVSIGLTIYGARCLRSRLAPCQTRATGSVGTGNVRTAAYRRRTTVRALVPALMSTSAARATRRVDPQHRGTSRPVIRQPWRPRRRSNSASGRSRRTRSRAEHRRGGATAGSRSRCDVVEVTSRRLLPRTRVVERVARSPW